MLVPILCLAPVVAAFAWRGLTPGRTRLAAVALALIVAGVTTAALWATFAFPACEFGRVYEPIQLLAPSALVGMVIGAGPAVSGVLATAVLRRDKPWWAVIVGALAGLCAILVSVGASTTLLVGPLCQRPPLS